MEKPSFKSSPWIRGAPHRVFSRDIRRTRWRISLDTGGRPGFLRRDFHVQKSLNPLRCQPMTVSGLTITRAWRQPGHRQDRMTQKTLSAFRSDGRGLFRFRTATCCRRARISVWSAARSAKISMILCMPERVSGGDAKFQGFCDRWNKWEGHHEEIDRRQAIGVICKECPPRLRWRRWVTDHVFRDGGLGDGKAKLQKLAMDPRCAPPCVLPRHPSDQIADLPRHRRSARFSPPRLPCPEKPERLAVPTDDGLGPDDYQGVAPARP